MSARADNFRRALAQAMATAKEAEETVLRVGITSEQHYEDGTPVAYVAAIHEYGSGNIPPRPFFRPTLKEQDRAWSKLVQVGLAESLQGGRGVNDVFEMVGILAASDVKGTIASITSPELKASTIAARNRKYKSASPSGKKSVKPLVDTGLLLASITHWTAKKGSK